MLNQQIVGDRGDDEEGKERGGERKMQRGRGSGGGERENEQKGLNAVRGGKWRAEIERGRKRKGRWKMRQRWKGEADNVGE